MRPLAALNVHFYRHRAILAFILIAATFLFAASRDLRRPGFCGDEAYDAVYALQMAQGRLQEATDWSVTAAGRKWPLRIGHPYDFSAFAMYRDALAFKLSGVSVESVRLAGLAMALLVLIGLYSFARQWFSESAALAACALLASDPAFFLLSRLSSRAEEISVAAFSISALAFFSFWYRRRATWAFGVGAFLLGFALNISFKAAAPLIAFATVCSVLVPKGKRPARRDFVCALAAFLLGALNPIAYNLSHEKLWVRALAGLQGATPAGADNRAVWHNLALRAGQLWDVLGGFAVEPLSPPYEAGRWAFLVAFGALLAFERRRRIIAFLLAAQAVMLAATCVTPAGYNEQHLIVLWPLPCLTVALGFDLLGRRVGKTASAAIFGVLLLCQCFAARRGFRQITAGPGGWFFSDAVYGLESYLTAHGLSRPVCPLSGVGDSLYVLSRGQIDVIEPSWWNKFRRGDMAGFYRQSFLDPTRRYILLAQTFESREASLGAERVARESAQRFGHRLVLEKSFADSRGRDVFLLYR